MYQETYKETKLFHWPCHWRWYCLGRNTYVEVPVTRAVRAAG